MNILQLISVVFPIIIIGKLLIAHLSMIDSLCLIRSYLEPSPNATTCYADNMKVSNFSEVRGTVCVSWDGLTSYYYECRLPGNSLISL